MKGLCFTIGVVAAFVGCIPPLDYASCADFAAAIFCVAVAVTL